MGFNNVLKISNMVQSYEETSRNFITFIVYMTILLDNILLTVIVPILPDYLSQLDEASIQNNLDNLQENVKYKNLYLHYVSTMFGSQSAIAINETLPDNLFHFDVVNDKLWNNNKLNEENSSVGFLLAIKALVQLIATPFVTSSINSYGYRIPAVFGTFGLFVASLTFALGKNYFLLFLARAIQGVASACISVCGMSIIAQLYPEEKKRSQILGIVLGSMALGVLLGYPFGGVLYALCGKSAPFYILAVLTLSIFALEILYLDLHCTKQTEVCVQNTNYTNLLSDPIILEIVGAIFVSTIAMAILEPCLPIWLMATLKPEKWQIGTVFIPDSIGYFISTNFFAMLAHKVGRMRTSIISLFIVGLSCLIIPQANSIMSLVLPHFALGIGIGTLDVALVPLLASIVDSRYANDDETTSASGDSSYGAIYAIQQISVSMAYFLGPMLGGEISQYIGFSWLMYTIGTANILYAIFLYLCVLGIFFVKSKENRNSILLNTWPSQTNSFATNEYKRFYNTMDMP